MKLYYKDRAVAEAVCHALREIAPVFSCPYEPEKEGTFKGRYYVEGSDDLMNVLRLAAIAFPPFKTREVLLSRLRQTIKDGDKP